MRTFLREGASLQAIIEEIIDGSTFIVSLEGKLYRVKNGTQHRFRLRDKIYLIVHNESPLELMLDPRFYNHKSFERFA